MYKNISYSKFTHFMWVPPPSIDGLSRQAEFDSGNTDGFPYKGNKWDFYKQ